MNKLLILIATCAHPLFAALQKSENPALVCSLNIVEDDPNSSPLVVDFTGNFIDPIALNDVRIVINHDESIWVACPGGTISIPQVGSINSLGELAACDAGNIVLIEGTRVSYNSINCTLDESSRPSLLSRTYSEPCESGGTITSVGYPWIFDILPVFAACTKPNSYLTFYVKYVISRWANALRGHTPCSTIKSFDDNIPFLYSRNNTERILQELGYDDEFYLEEGQLAANDDFYYPFQRDATSCYINVAPQWHTFKEGNWAAVQRSITSLVRQGGHGDFITYSGTLGVTSLEDRENDGLATLYLLQPELPVPRWFWKLVYSAQAKQGNIIFGYNNPYVFTKNDVDNEFSGTLCSTDELQNLTWLIGVDNTDSQFGYIYGCLLHDAFNADIYEIVQNLLQNEKREFIGNLHEFPLTN